MELVIAAVAGGIAVAAPLALTLWKIISAAVDNLLDWMIYNFGNESARSSIEEKWRRRHEF